VSERPQSIEGHNYESAREALVHALRPEVTDARVLSAIGRVPRERFVARELRAMAYDDRPLPIGHGQTTSQPRMIAIMLQELRLKGDESVLEVGTGSGYETALLAELASRVVSVELVPSLAESARRALRDTGYGRVEVQVAGETLGWPAGGPYDAIVVGAATPRVPQALVDQLAVGGRLVLPVGGSGSQDLIVVESTPAGLRVQRKGACRFVPLFGPEANRAPR
jgi:protein-L-isoaspartate(D-aspartate) O-methyltransferase